MWKFVSRGIRESLERRANCRTNVCSPHTSQDGTTSNVVKCEVNQIFSTNETPSINRSSVAWYFGICRGIRAADPVSNGGRGSRFNPRYSWAEAVEWSGLLALGWVICQSLCLHRRFFGPDPDAVWRKRISQVHDVRISNLLGNLLCLEPRHILPITNCVGNEIENSQGSQSPHDLGWTSQTPYGPITVEEALQDAGDDFTRIHRIVMGEYEFQMGMKALEEKRYKEAVKHFSTGSNLSSSASMFNLALCHEMGLGTLVDHKEAAKRYRAAAENGHADAMYNLGVFHAQGRGGLEVDVNMARKLFTEAAKLGQLQAQQALSLEKTNNRQNIADKEMKGISMRFVAQMDKVKKNSNKSNCLLAQLVG